MNTTAPELVGVDWAVVALYFLVIAAIVVCSSRRVVDTTDYCVPGTSCVPGTFPAPMCPRHLSPAPSVPGTLSPAPSPPPQQVPWQVPPGRFRGRWGRGLKP